MSERKVVFVDGTDIYSVNIEQNPVKSRLISATHTVTGIAIDWRDENVYWCMGETAGEINVFSRETETEYTLISTNLTYPKSLTILPFQNIMLWISGTAGSNKLEKSKLDGSDREVLVSSTSSGGMKGLTVDYSTNTLYFIDDWLVKRCDIEGKQMTTFTPESALLSPMKVLPYKYKVTLYFVLLRAMN
ncbi:low-density lipoprotein receptor-related protein 8-like [Mercenaria mercenaria]|uniref:low-density lipoprotein receptor-related protein 8-like n=1 Tax=Mercenaria mercenaria TaxID=6596 RepID=UPI00234E6401|nr:low-density lipoprotein receptor-related protein 8-like [Mercenaria mercenaria]